MPVSESPLGAEVIRIVVAVTTLSGIAVALRLLTRCGLVRHPGYDDGLITLAYAFSCTFTGLAVQQVYYGLGRHQDTVPDDDIEDALKPFYFSIIAYNLSLTFTKGSILAQYLRLVIEKRMRIICWVMIGVITAYGIWLFFTAVFTCTPIKKFWQPDIAGKCINERTLWFTNAGLNIATDFIIFVLPIPVIVRLNLPTRQKVLLGLIFTIGLFTCITSIIRLHSLSQVANATDKTYYNAMAASWSGIEINTAIFCCSCSTLKPLVSRLSPGALSSQRSRGTDISRRASHGLQFIFPQSHTTHTTGKTKTPQSSHSDQNILPFHSKDRDQQTLQNMYPAIGREYPTAVSTTEGSESKSMEQDSRSPPSLQGSAEVPDHTV